jgi:hypothetical protein
LAAARPGDVVVVDDVLAPVSSNESLSHLMNRYQGANHLKLARPLSNRQRYEPLAADIKLAR